MTTLKEFRPGLWLTELHLDDFDVRGVVIIGEKMAVAWDSLSHPRDMQPVRALLAQKDWQLVYSHADWDHVWGTAGLSFQNKIITAHKHCLARFSDDVPRELQEKQADDPDKWSEVVLVPPTQIFETEFSIDLGNVTLILHHLFGHTHDCIVGFIPEWGVLLAGDTVETPLPVINPESPLDDWIAALQKWGNDARVKHVIPAHGTVGGRELIWHNVLYLQNLRNDTPIQLPENMDDFYRETHQENLRLVQRLGCLQQK